MIVDNLFGTCQNVFAKQPVLKFYVTKNLKEVLARSLEELLNLEYVWSDVYTQCIIGGLLESYVLDVTPDLVYCDEKERKRLRYV